MTFEEILSNPLVLLALGWVASEWNRSRDGHTKSVQVDTDLKARLANVETWQRDHNTIHGCVRELAATTKAMANTVDRLTRRFDHFMAQHQTALPVSRRSPFDFQEARDWIDPEQPS